MRIGVATLVACLLAATFAVPQVAGIATWKWMLGLFGLAMIIVAGRSPK
jgi:hypothetical protein